MEVVYVLAILFSIFCHCMGIIYSPVEASTDSCMFIIVATMFLHKMKLRGGLELIQNASTNIMEFLALCLAMQVLLIAVWLPINQTLQYLVDLACNPFSNGRSLIVGAIQGYTASVCILAMESAMLAKAFQIEDLQRFFGAKDDLVSESILSIVAQQQKTVMRREKLRRRR